VLPEFLGKKLCVPIKEADSFSVRSKDTPSINPSSINPSFGVFQTAKYPSNRFLLLYNIYYIIINNIYSLNDGHLNISNDGMMD
jgi:hypothetical protein